MQQQLQDNAHKVADQLAATSVLGAITANLPLITEWMQMIAALIGICSGLAALRFYLKRTSRLDEED
jgi:hypothetical protein